jgi:hypothetical protein
LALPFLAACRAAWEFFSERVALEPWAGLSGAIPVEVEVEPPQQPPPPPPSGPPDAPPSIEAPPSA